MSKTWGEKTPVALVTGFLGSGKTTLLSRLMKRYSGRRIAWVVNEFGSLDIDGMLLRDDKTEVLTVPGGSIFCRCTSTAFLRIMGRIAVEARNKLIDGVIIEASGMARPDVFDGMLADFKLDDALKVASVTAVIDPVNFLLVRQSLPAADVQVRCADYILLNKAEITDPKVMEEAEQVAGALAPRAFKWHCIKCAPEPDVLVTATRDAVRGTWVEEPDTAFIRFSAEISIPLDIERLISEINAIGRTIYRAKGILRSPDGWFVFDWTPTSIQ